MDEVKVNSLILTLLETTCVKPVIEYYKCNPTPTLIWRKYFGCKVHISNCDAHL